MNNLLHQFVIGILDQEKRLEQFYKDNFKTPQTYPPYNIIKLDDDKFLIEIAVAGLQKSEIDIELDDNVLTVKSNTLATNTVEYIYKGIASRSFSRSFNLMEDIELKSAELVDGMLKLVLERIVINKKPSKKIKIDG